MEKRRITYHGLFIAFEGGEGSGKSTQAKLLHEALVAEKVATLWTREPGGTQIGEKLREMLLASAESQIEERTELLLFGADRAQHVRTKIIPALGAGLVVITDRFQASTMAYQSYAGGLAESDVAFINDFATVGVTPDITFFLDVEPEVGLKRAKRTNRTRFEDKTLEYHRRVREGFLKQRTDTWITVDATLPTTEVIHNRIWKHVSSMLATLQTVQARWDAMQMVEMVKGSPKAARADVKTYKPANLKVSGGETSCAGL